jgi:hypothetical protein
MNSDGPIGMKIDGEFSRHQGRADASWDHARQNPNLEYTRQSPDGDLLRLAERKAMSIKIVNTPKRESAKAMRRLQFWSQQSDEGGCFRSFYLNPSQDAFEIGLAELAKRTLAANKGELLVGLFALAMAGNASQARQFIEEYLELPSGDRKAAPLSDEQMDFLLKPKV